jgi:hypothetical protein
MAKTELDRLSDDATVWIFGIAPSLDARGSETLLRNVDAFLEQWTAHNVAVTAARDLRESRFLVVAAEADTEKSGCSIDKLFGFVHAAEKALGVSMLDANQIFFRDANGVIASATRSEFAGAASASTVVFDTTAERLGDLRSGAWERPARESWHAQLIPVSA